MESKNIIKIGRINSAEDNPNHIPLRARPLLLLKYLDIVVDEVWDINPCPENLIRKIAITKKKILLIKENKNEDKKRIIITINE